MRPDQYEHLHSHLERLQARLDVLDDAVVRLQQIEVATSRMELTLMATASEQINNLSSKIDAMATVVTDVHSDFEALRAVMESERENLSATGQAALDAANAKAADLAQKLTDLDVEVGDADGSDIPTDGGVTGTTPADGGDATVPGDDAPPAGEGAVIAPDVLPEDEDFRPTA